MKTVKELISHLENAPKRKGTCYVNQDDKNAIKPLYQLIAMAQMRPDGIWDGD